MKLFCGVFLMTKTVVYTSPIRLSCISVTPAPDVILCLTDSSLLAPVICPDSESEVPYDFTTLEAKLNKSWKNGDNCGAITYSYVFAYDETLLAVPGTALVASQISGVFCEGCLTDWVQEEVGNEVSLVDNGNGTLTLTTQHGCTYTFNGSFT